MSERFDLTNNHIFVLADAAGGVYNAEQLRIISEAADEESAFIKVTEDQRVGFMVSPENFEKLQQKLNAAGIILRHYQSNTVPSPRACLGEVCPHKEQDALGDAITLSNHFAQVFSDSKPFVSIAMNGCARACLSSATQDIHMVGEPTGYKISIGGKGSEIPQIGQFLAENISKEQLPEVLTKVLSYYFENKQETESLNDMIERVGISAFTSQVDGSAPEEFGEELSVDESVEAQTEGAGKEAALEDELFEGESLEAAPVVAEATEGANTDDIMEEPLAEVPAEAAPEVAAAEDDGFSLGDDLEPELMGASPEETLPPPEESSGTEEAAPSQEELVESSPKSDDDGLDFEDVTSTPSITTAEDPVTPPAPVSEDPTRAADSPDDALLMEDEEMEVEEASSDDAEKMANTLRSEHDQEEEAIRHLGQENNMEGEEDFLSFEDKVTPITKSQAPAQKSVFSSSKSSARVSVSTSDGKLQLQLGKVKCQLPLASIIADEQSEIELNGKLIKFSNQDGILTVECDSLQIEVPIGDDSGMAA